MESAIDLRRRVFLQATAGGAAAGLVGASPTALAQGKPLPAFASWKSAKDVIVHSASGIETKRTAFGTSGITSTDILFVRNNLASPDAAIVANADAWAVEFAGVANPRRITVGELKRMGLGTVAMVLQCSGNGRGFFGHKASGSQWKTGAAGSTLWSGVPMKAVVEALGGVAGGMRYMTSSGGETIPAGIEPLKVMVERSVPWTAMETAILAWELNSQPVPLAHGGPLRMIIPGYYGVNQVKYVRRVAFTADETKANIQASGYRVRDIGVKGAPTQPTMWEMNLKSFVTHPGTDGERLSAGITQIYGVAFSGTSAVRGVEVSIDGGATWRPASFVGPDLGRYAWRHFVLPVQLSAGSYAITSRATDADGQVQPELRVENERAYGHNGWRDHTVKVTVG